MVIASCSSSNRVDDNFNAANAYIAVINHLMRVCPSVGKRILDELRSQRSRLKMIASENYSSLSVQLTMGNLLTDKYCEGSPFKRFYSGCENVDAIEWECSELTKELFGCEFAFVQPHSGSDANLLATMAILTNKIQNPKVLELGYKTVNNLSDDDYQNLRKEMMGSVCLGPSLNSGGHLTHGGVRLNIMSKLMQCYTYDVDPETCLFDYDTIASKAKKYKPTVIIGSYSSYSRRLNFAKLKQIADDCGAVLWVDMAHFAGLVAGGVFTGEENPVPYADIITTTTHKTLRGPRGGMVLAKKEFGDTLSKACPMMMGGPLPHVIAAKLVALREASTVSFKQYASKIVENARYLSEKLLEQGVSLLTGGTDNHMLIMDLRAFNLTGMMVENALSAIGIAVNRNALPTDPVGKWQTSGIRLGTPALTSLGMGKEEMKEIADIIVKTLRNINPNLNVDDRNQARLSNTIAEELKIRVRDLLGKFPLYPEINIEPLD